MKNVVNQVVEEQEQEQEQEQEYLGGRAREMISHHLTLLTHFSPIFSPFLL